VSGLVLAFMPDATQFAPATDGWGAALTHALVQSLIAVGVLSAGTIVAIQSLPAMALRTGLADAAAIDGTSAGAVEAEAATLVGKPGIVRTLLRPGGQVEVAGRPYGAVSENGEFLQPGDAVTVVGARFGELVVRKAG
jgi:membrane-bound ClpP family serine protease